MGIFDLSLAALIANALLFGEEEQDDEENMGIKKSDNEQQVTERHIDIEGLGDIKLVRPSPEILRAAQDAYISVYNESLRKGLKTTKETEKELMDKGVITGEDKKKNDGLTVSIGNAIMKLSKATDLEERTKIEEEIRNLKRQKINNIIRTTGYYSGTAESLAHKEEHLFLMQKCALTVCGRPLWNSLDELKKEAVEKEKVIGSLMIEFTDFLNDLSDTFPDYKNELKSILDSQSM